ncbi:MAG: peptidoglycan-binding protein [Candidatus Omnitrophota bacterium]|nr:peptidoglycan-binding protein [Candidatus Omnitrophota bacterium]
MKKKWVMLFSMVFLIFSLTGCATSRKQKAQEMETQGLRNQVTVLEAQLQSKDEEINNLKNALANAADEKTETRTQAKKQTKKTRRVGEIKSRPNLKQVQIALSNAGYYPGSLDGKMGKQTREALRAFQKAQGLPETGKADRATWKRLKGYLYKNVK